MIGRSMLALRAWAILMGPADESGGTGGGTGGGGGGAVAAPAAVQANEKPQTVDDAVAEMDRREAEREAARKRKATQRRNLAALRGQDAPADDDGEDDDDAPPKRKAQAEDKPKPKAKARQDDDDGDNADEDEDDEAADKARARRKTASEDDDSDDAEDDDDDEDTGRAKRKASDEDGDDGEATDEDDDSDDEDTDLDGQRLRIPKGTPKALVDTIKSMARDLKSDYTRKTQELAQGRTYIEQRHDATEQAMQTVQRAQQAVVALAQQIIGEPPSPMLAQSDPQQYVQAKALYEARVQQLQGLTGESGKLTQHQQQLQQQRTMQSLHEENDKLVRALPALAQPENRRAFMQEAVQIAARSGFSPQDVAAVGDHRMLHLLGRLMYLERQFATRGDAEKSVRQKLANVPPKSLRPGTANHDAGKGQKRADARKAFMQSRRTMQDMKRYIDSTGD